MLEIPIDEALRWGRSNNPQLLELKQNVLEAERNVDKTKKESRFNASVNASIGFNQVADNFGTNPKLLPHWQSIVAGY